MKGLCDTGYETEEDGTEVSEEEPDEFLQFGHLEQVKYRPSFALPISRGLFREGPCIIHDELVKLMIALSCEVRH